MSRNGMCGAPPTGPGTQIDALKEVVPLVQDWGIEDVFVSVEIKRPDPSVATAASPPSERARG